VKRVFLIFLLPVFSASLASASWEVRFIGGGSLKADSVEQRGGLTILTLPGGGVLALDEGRIFQLRRLEAEAPPDPVPPGKTQPPVSEAEADVDPGIASGKPDDTRGASPDTGELIRGAALRHGVDPELLRCLILVESGFDPEAVSPKGAMGLAQLMPGTAKDLGVEDPFDPIQAVDAAARHLGRLLKENEGRFVPALAAYNAGRGAVGRYGGLPPYGETIRYIEKILSLYHAP
jgi:hypothetical protein